jgi:uncharacterized protein YjbI with pentapeptide repeats
LVAANGLNPYSSTGFGIRQLKPNLSGAHLSRVDLRHADLRGVNFSEAYLSGVSLSKTNLSEAYLSKANLSEADLREASLSKANLSEANLSKANLSEADLREANLSEAIIGWTILGNIDLSTVQGLETVEHWGLQSSALIHSITRTARFSRPSSVGRVSPMK